MQNLLSFPSKRITLVASTEIIYLSFVILMKNLFVVESWLNILYGVMFILHQTSV